jgi:hypothetical protein
MTFEIGDRVQTIKDWACKKLTGKKGTIVKVPGSGTMYGIEFDENIRGHDCDGKAKMGHGFWLTGDYFELSTAWKKGDRVRIKPLDRFILTNFHNKTGTLDEDQNDSSMSIYVIFDEEVSNGFGQASRRWRCDSRTFEKIDEEIQEEQKEGGLPSGYTQTPDGFITNKDNWKPGKWLI